MEVHRPMGPWRGRWCRAMFSRIRMRWVRRGMPIRLVLRSSSSSLVLRLLLRSNRCSSRMPIHLVVRVSQGGTVHHRPSNKEGMVHHRHSKWGMVHLHLKSNSSNSSSHHRPIQ